MQKVRCSAFYSIIIGSQLIPPPYSLVHPRPILPYCFLSSPFQYLLYCRAVWPVNIRTLRVAVWRAVRNIQGVSYWTAGIAKIYYMKTAGHVLTKPVQTEEKSQNFFLSKLFFFVVHISAAIRCECVHWENGRSGGKSFCVLEYHTVRLWLLCNVHLVQIILPNIAKWPRWPKSTDHCSSEEYRRVCGKNLNNVSLCRVTGWCTHRKAGVVKKWVFVWLNNSIRVDRLVFML